MHKTRSVEYSKQQGYLSCRISLLKNTKNTTRSLTKGTKIIHLKNGVNPSGENGKRTAGNAIPVMAM